MRYFNAKLAALALAGSIATAGMAGENVMVVFDGSNSMWGQIDGTAKIEIARDVIQNLLGEWTEDRQVGLMAYGHRRRGDCSDIETLVVPAKGAREDILNRINAITPTGKTPLSDAIEQAAIALSYTDQPATVVLISDGLESCGRNPCALAAALEKAGVGFTAHVVGFGLSGDTDAASLSCIAENTGGRYISASNAAELGQALSDVALAVAEAPEPVPEAAPAPEAPKVILNVPETAIAGSEITVGWAPAIMEKDYVIIASVDSKEGTYETYVTVGDQTEGLLQMPAFAGQYEVRYVLNETGEIQGVEAIEIIDPGVTITGPDQITAGAKFNTSWQDGVNKRDYVTIVPMGADEGTYASYFTVEDYSKGILTAASEPGLYELRYVLNQGARTVARQAIEVTAPEVGVSGPETALAGSRVEVSWTGAVANNDYITIVPMGADEGTFGNYKTLRNETKTDLKAPADPGIYEIRYILREGSKTVARQMIEITDPEVSLEAPDEVRAGDKLRVGWNGAVADDDYVALVPMGSEDKEFGTYFVVRDKTGNDMKAPDETGLYELRYILREGGRVLARAPVEVLAADAALATGASLSAPDTAAPGAVIEVNWDVSSDSVDQRITLARSNQAIFTWMQAVKISGDGPIEITMPNEPGVYELRYLDLSNQAVLSRKVIKVE